MRVRLVEVREADALQKKRVCAYARMSSDSSHQEDSLENQTATYERLIKGNPEYDFAGVYADQGISGYCENRPQFQEMIERAGAGEIDLIITKSISRFARNTVTVLKFARELKELGVGIFFEKENINTLDAKRFLGYGMGEDGKLTVNRKQAPIVKRLYQEFLDGKTTDYIKRIFEREGVENWNGGTTWQVTTLASMLGNEKYKGDALLQKSYMVDFLSEKRTPNNGEIQMYYVEDDHEAIIPVRIWECVQLEQKRRKSYLEEHGTNSYSHNTELNPFASKIVCGCCNKVFARKGWRSSRGFDRKVWQCSERYKVKGVIGCGNRHVEESTLEKAYVMAWNAILKNRQQLAEKWKGRRWNAKVKTNKKRCRLRARDCFRSAFYQLLAALRNKNFSH